MLRTLVKALIVLLAMLSLLAVLFVVAAGELLERDAWRTSLGDAVQDALGLPIAWEGASVRTWPPRLVLEAPSLVVDPDQRDAVGLRADSMELGFAVRALLSRRIEIDRVLVRRPDIVVTRTPEGWQRPVRARGREDGSSDPLFDGGPDSGPDGGPRDRAAAASGGAAGVASREPDRAAARRVSLSQGSLVVRDRTGARALEWRFADVAAEARTGPDGRLEIDLDAGLVSAPLSPLALEVSGRLRLEATRAPGEAVALSVRLTLESEDLSGFVEGRTRGEEPLAISGDLQLARSGRIVWTGRATRRGELDLAARFEEIDLAAFRPLLPDPAMRISGRSTGDGHWVGPLTAPTRLKLDFRVERGALQMPEYSVEGAYHARLEILREDPARGGATSTATASLPLSLAAPAPTPPSPPTTSGDRVVSALLTLDLTAARLDYQGRFVKPRGRPAEVVTRFQVGEAGAIESESRVKLRQVEGEIRLNRREADANEGAAAGPEVDRQPPRSGVSFTG